MSDISRFLAESAMLQRRSYPIILSSRVRFARNIATENFPGALSPQQRESVKKKILGALEKSEYFRNATVFEMQDLAKAEQALLVERHLISRELQEREGAAVVISPDQKTSVMINEEDHFRIQIVDANSDLVEILSRAKLAEAALASIFKFAFSERYGFLTACPTNLGTGLRVSAMVHLPGLVMDGQMEKVVRALNMCGLTVRGSFGEGSDATGSIFQISNQHTLGIPVEKIADTLQEWLGGIVEQEKNARRRILQRGKAPFFDQISRAYGELRYAFLLSENEGADMLSLIRMACDLGIFPEYVRSRIDELFVESQTAHIIFRQSRGNALKDGDGVDKLRATLFREYFSMIPPPDFSAE